VLFVRQGTLLAQPFDVGSRELRGAPAPIVEQVAIGEVLRPAVSASPDGVVIYRTGVAAPLRQFVWFDRTGVALERIGTPEVNQTNPDLSPDGTRLAFQRAVAGNTDIWLLPLSRGAVSRFTIEESIESIPAWSPDGSRLAFSSNRSVSAGSPQEPTRIQPGTSNLWVMSADGSRPAELLVTSPGAKWVSDWSPDGRSILYCHLDQQTGTHDTWVTGADGSAPVQVLASRADERDAQFSPDGRWIAFQSDESGRYEIYIQRYPGPGGKERISTAGGTQVRWRKDGRELFYVTPDNELAAVRLTLPSGAGAPQIVAPQILFATQMVPGGVGIARQQYVVAPDGQRFLVNTREVTGVPAPPITLLLNWRGPRP
jgi:Tol biopolymer transport system component